MADKYAHPEKGEHAKGGLNIKPTPGHSPSDDWKNRDPRGSINNPRLTALLSRAKGESHKNG